jgi:hypothetical protein
VAVVLLFVGAGLDSTPEITAPTSEWTAHFEDSGNRVQVIVGSILLALSAFAFLGFFWALCERLSSTEDGRLRLSSLARSSGTVFAVLVATTASVSGAVALGTELADAPLPSAEVMIQIESVGGAMFVIGGGFAASLLVAASSVVMLRGGALPTWLGWFGVVVAILLLLSVFFFPLLTFFVWVVIVSVAQLVRPEA